MKKQSLLKGALILTIAALITKILGFANSIIQSRILGSEGIGLVMMVMPLMGLLMTLTTLGLPVAISKLVAEAEVQNKTTQIKQILVVSLVVTGSLSILFVMITLGLGPIFSTHLLTDQRSYYSLLALIPIIPIFAVSGVLKGYFRGRQTMTPIAVSQVLEQIVRIALIFFIVQWLLPYGIEYAAAGAILCSVIGEAFSLFYLVFKFRTSNRYKVNLRQPHKRKIWSQGKHTLLELLHTGLPTTGNGLIHSIARVISPILITQGLAKAGMSSVLITKQFGMLAGFVMPLLFFPGFINHSLAAAMVPAISEANAQKNYRLIHQRVYQAVRIALIVGAPSTVILYVFAEPLMEVIYHAPEAAVLLKVLAPFFLFHYFHAPLQSTLVGLGYAKAAMMNNLLSRAVSLALIYPLCSNPVLGIKGVLLAMSIGVILETFLHFFSMVKLIGYHLKTFELLKVVFSGLLMGYMGLIFFNHLKGGLLFQTMMAIVSSLFLYLLLLILLRVIRRNDIVRVPLIGKRLSFFFRN
ncbi:stage V sporulation protein B [Ammoniphilus sp. CFH 90114]|uniref:stage V sporulation protein B n=1 Tax=Ammoniphilus sp. CFH 90114 TaxID=2493665 RepID=UPI00100FAA33|nr:stage V sporulation protein B [Ammoniphilus sp. CFH 90114]RXT15402.1 stage V sporulation protein B [Ammoniphilus sp. CFH 90114]